jgi:integrase
LGLADTSENREIAQAKANQMEIDYIYERFDFTLEKYKLEKAPEENAISFLELFQQFKEFKLKILKPSSHHNYVTTENKLKEMPETVIKSPKNIRAWLVEHNTQEQARRTLQRLSSSYDWGIEQELVEEPNPFTRFKKFKKVISPDPDPFTVLERDMIIKAFEEQKPHFANFVKFLFFTGCRPSEACGLRWKNVDLLGNKIIFCEVVVEGKRERGTKTQQRRTFPINSQLKDVLQAQRANDEKVFFGERHKAIDMHNFTTRKWKPLLKNLPIRYRGCYHCRHTFITLCLQSGIEINRLAKWVGNSPEIILKHYAGLIGEDEVPEL